MMNEPTILRREGDSLNRMEIRLDVAPDALKAQIESSDALRRRIGLAGVAGGGRIKRAAWEKGAALSTYQVTVLELGLGSPVNQRVTK